MYSKDALEQAEYALRSLLSKCEKTLPKLRPGTSQHTLLRRRIDALGIAAALIDRGLGKKVGGEE